MKKNTSRQSRRRLQSLDVHQLGEVSGGIGFRTPLLGTANTLIDLGHGSVAWNRSLWDATSMPLQRND